MRAVFFKSLFLISFAPLLLKGQSVTDLGNFFPEDISADGSILVGRVGFNGPIATWEDGNVELLALSSNTSDIRMSSDGSTIITNYQKWVNGVVSPIIEFVDETEFYALDLSSDGTVIIGDVTEYPEGYEGPVHQSSAKITNGFFQKLGTPGGVESPVDPRRVDAVSRDGGIVVGNFFTPGPGIALVRHPVRWNGNAPTELPSLAVGGLPDLGTEIQFVSDDGSAAVGVTPFVAGIGYNYHPVIWKGNSVSELTAFDGLNRSVEGISADGSIVAGNQSAGAFLWTELTGIRDLKDVLLENDPTLDLTGVGSWKVNALSLDGNRLACYSYINGAYNGWLVEVKDRLVVNDDGDEPDEDPNDGFLDTDLATPGLQVTLRAAIEAANVKAGPDTITFDIPGGGIPVIAPQTSLPAITEDLEIDGTTQPGSGLVCLSGASAPGDGLQITNGAVGLKGLEALQFPGAAFRFSGGADHFVERCFIGVNSAGSPFGNGTGIAMNAVSRARFGNLSGTLKNIISANGNGIDLTNCVDILMHQNFVGTAPDGSTPIPNTGIGLLGNGVQNLEVCSSTAVPVVIFGKQYCLRLTNVQGSVFENIHVGLSADGQTTAPDVQEGAFFEFCENMRVIQSAFSGATGHMLRALGGDNIEVSDVRVGTDATGAVEFACSVGLAFDGCKNLTIGSDEGTTVVGGETAIKIENVTEGQNTIKNVHAGGGIAGIGGIRPLFPSTQFGLVIQQCANLLLTGKPGDAMMPDNNSLIDGTETAAEIEDSDSITLERFSAGTGGGGVGGIAGIGLKLLRCVDLQVGKPQMAPCMIAANNGVVADFILPGQVSRFENIWLNLRADGQASIAGPMQTAFRLQDSGNVELNRINVGATLEAFRLLRANGVNLTNPFIGQAPGSSSVFDVDLGIFAKNCSQLSVGAADSPAFLTAKQGMLLEECSNVTLRQIMLNLTEDRSASQGNGERGILCKLTSVIDISGMQTGAFSQAAFEATDSDAINIDDVAIGLNAAATEAFPVDIGLSFKRCSNLLFGLKPALNRIIAGKAFMIDDLQATGPEGNAIGNVHIGLAADGSALGAIDTAIDVNNARDLSLDSFRVSRANHDAFWLRVSERIRLENSWFGVGLDPETNFQIGGDAVRVEGCSDVGLIQNQLRNALGSGLRVDNQSSKITHRKNLIFDNVVPPAIDTPQVHIDVMTSILTKMNFRFNGTLLEGTITGPPNTTVTLDVYATDPGAPFVESRYHLGSEDITFDAAGNATPATSLEGTVPPGWQATFTLTDSTLGTTDFSPAMSVTAAPDRDHDGLPDFWEERYPTILDPDDDSDAHEDPDHDGRDNTQEFVEWTDPKTSDLSPSLFMTQSPDEIEFTVNVKSGRYYTLQRSPTMDSGEWQNIETKYPVNGGELRLRDLTPVPGASKMFYRLRSEVPATP